MKDKEKPNKPCAHTDTVLVVVEATVTCEKTARQCLYCGLIIEEKTDCR